MNKDLKLGWVVNSWVDKMKEYYSHPKYLREYLTNEQFFKFEQSNLCLMEYIKVHDIQLKLPYSDTTESETETEEELQIHHDSDYDVYDDHSEHIPFDEYDENYKNYYEDYSTSDEDTHIEYSDNE